MSLKHDLWYMCTELTEMYDIFELLSHTDRISRKTVKWSENTICVTCALNSRRYEIFEVFLHLVVISCKTDKWAQNTTCDTCASNSRKYEIFEVFPHNCCNKPKRGSNELRTRFVILVHWTHGDMRFLKFYLIQL